MTNNLWPNMPNGTPCKIEVFGATGDYASGKTILGLTIAPGNHPAGHAFEGQPKTLYLDFEKSGGSYESIGCKRVDVPERLMKKHGGAYRPLDAYVWFIETIEKIQPGQFEVIMADPITDIESGMVAWVKANPGKVGLTAGQIARSGGLLWGAVKDLWKQVLLQLSAKCQTFYFTSHLRTVWVGNQATNKKEPKGKETLMELASLYLWLDRETDKEGNVQTIPSARVLKSRMSATVFADDGSIDVIQLLPPRLPQATARAIRQYITTPPDYGKLERGEQVQVHQQTEEERIAAETRLYEAKREAVEAEMEAKGLAREKPSEPAPAVQPVQKAIVDTSETDEEFLARFLAARRIERDSDDVEANDEQDKALKVTDSHVRAMQLISSSIEDEHKAAFKAAVRQELVACGVARFRELNRYDANRILLSLSDMLTRSKRNTKSIGVMT